MLRIVRYPIFEGINHSTEKSQTTASSVSSTYLKVNFVINRIGISEHIGKMSKFVQVGYIISI